MNCFRDCGSCNDKCDKCHKCGPAAYNDFVSLTVDPYDSDVWNFNFCGKIFKLHAPQSSETDTSLTTNYDNSTLVYAAERHTDIITGEQLGQLIRVEDLRDTNCDYDTTARCYELIYHKYGECPDGCRSVEDSWATFSIDSENALRDYLHYVRGVNKDGCPFYLDVPANTDEWYWTGWRTSGQHKEFGYFQPRHVTSEEFPLDENGNHIFVTEDPATHEPLVGRLPLNCLLNNLIANLGMAVTSEWSVIDQTTGFGASFNNVDGNFVIRWTDWNDRNDTLRAGYGEIRGQLVWTVDANIYTGDITIHISSLNFYSAKWTKDMGVTISSQPTLHLQGVSLDTGQLVNILDKTYGSSSWSVQLNQRIPCDITLTVTPGDTPLEPLNFVHIFVDWVGDDKGYLGARFNPRLSGWTKC